MREVTLERCNAALEQYVVCYKSNRRIALEAIKYLPAGFGGSAAEMNQAISKSLEEKGIHA